MPTLAELGEVAKEQMQEISKVNPDLTSMAIEALARYGKQTHHGMNLRDKEEESYNKGIMQNRNIIERAMEDPRYTHRGNQVYARNRRMFPTQGEKYIQQTVRDSKGNKHKTYVRVHHPNPVLGGLTRWDEDRPLAHIKAHPTWGGSPKKELKNRYIATHEAEHAKEFAGAGKYRQNYKRAVQSAYRRHPEKSTLRELAGRGYARSGTYQRKMKEHVGRGEGRADLAAWQQHRIHPATVSAYPSISMMDPDFARGYTEMGGPTRPGWSAMRGHKKEFKRRALEERSKFGKGLRSPLGTSRTNAVIDYVAETGRDLGRAGTTHSYASRVKDQPGLSPYYWGAKEAHKKAAGAAAEAKGEAAAALKSERRRRNVAAVGAAGAAGAGGGLLGYREGRRGSVG